MSDWVIEAANKRNEEFHRREAIHRQASTLWENLCRAIEQKVRTYQRLDVRPRDVEFSGAAPHTIHVALFPYSPQPPKTELGRITITFDQEHGIIEVHTGAAAPRKFPISLDQARHAVLTHDGRDISIEKFTELALRAALFPGEVTAGHERPDG